MATLFTSECVDFAWKYFQNIFIKILDEVAPVKEVRLKQRTEPWITSDILELLRERDRFYILLRKQGYQRTIGNFVNLEIKYRGKLKQLSQSILRTN